MPREHAGKRGTYFEWKRGKASLAVSTLGPKPKSAPATKQRKPASSEEDVKSAGSRDDERRGRENIVRRQGGVRLTGRSTAVINVRAHSTMGSPYHDPRRPASADVSTACRRGPGTHNGGSDECASKQRAAVACGVATCFPSDSRFHTYLSPFLLTMDNKSEDGTLRGNSIEAEQTGTPPREKRAAALRATKLIPIPFQPGGAFDSQVTSQEFVKGLYEDAEQSMHVLERSEIPLQRRDKRPLRAVGAEEEHNHLRAELETTKDELRKTKRALRDAQRQVEQWRTAAMKLSTAVERPSEQISIATEGQDVIEISDSE
ncbi:hypothetical protein B0H14DRAFT_3733509 [Mycena olivaceomarginata]|nr:hypothetical protein B0H14DRAFT_3733509 [Mycena olivaceomarginata]